MNAFFVGVAMAGGLAVLAPQTVPDRPSPGALRTFLCALDRATEYDWPRVLNTLPGGARLGVDAVRRDAELTSHRVGFATGFLIGQASWIGNPQAPKASGTLRLESEVGPLFESPDGPRELLVSLFGGTPVPFDTEVLTRAGLDARVAPSDGLMVGNYGRRMSSFSRENRLEVDSLVAFNLRRNVLEARLSSRATLCR